MVRNLFWNVDTINDFMNPNGRLYVNGAEEIKINLKKIIKIAYLDIIKVVNSTEAHTLESKEISINNPDYKTTFPPHGIVGTKGADFIEETKPFNPLIISHLEKKYDYSLVNDQRNIVLTKDAFDVFTNPHTKNVVDILEPQRVFIFGVVTEICVKYTVAGLLSHDTEIYVIEDAIKELNVEEEQKTKDLWKNYEIKLIQTNQLEKHLK